MARPRGGTCGHQNITKHAILLSRVLPATLREAAKALVSPYDSIAQSQMVRICPIFLLLFSRKSIMVSFLHCTGGPLSQEGILSVPNLSCQGKSLLALQRVETWKRYAKQRIRGDRNATHERSWCRSVRGFTPSPGRATGDGAHRWGDYGRNGCLTGC